ncbi:hypothetical protein [Psychrilyobacter sp.]|uniref:hypothetical protein n=1 Tax=Psychrilyobacter sp. TaxID=2586924 RepID=UPI00301AF34B
MSSEELREKIIFKLSSSFNIEKNSELGELSFDFKGLFLEETSKYILSKDLIYDSFSTKETMFYKTLKKEERIIEKKKFKEYITKNLDLLKGNKKNQMSSVATFIFVGKKLSKGDEKIIQGFSYHKSFLFGLKGWFNMKLIYIDLDTKKVVTNRFGKKNIIFFRSLIIN